jgi:hypothetical protein
MVLLVEDMKQGAKLQARESTLIAVKEKSPLSFIYSPPTI